MERELIAVLASQLALMELKNYIINIMTKEKLYCPETMGTFKMMFGFPQPTRMVRKISYGKEYCVNLKNYKGKI